MIKSNPQLNKQAFNFRENGEFPYFTRTIFNNGILGKVDYLDDAHKIRGKSLAIGMLQMKFFYQEKDFYAGQFTKTAFAKFANFDKTIAQYFLTLFDKQQKRFSSVLVRDFAKIFNETEVNLPIRKNGEPDFDFMTAYIRATQKKVVANLVAWAERETAALRDVTEVDA